MGNSKITQVNRMQYAKVIVNISHENIDKIYEYAIPKEWQQEAVIGTQVIIPFGVGNRQIKGFIIGITDTPEYDPKKIKAIISVCRDAVILESHFIKLAYWIKENYGATMNDALHVVLPIKKTVKEKEKRTITLVLEEKKALELLAYFQRKNQKARVRILEALLKDRTIPYEQATRELKITAALLRSLEEQKIVSITSKKMHRNPIQYKQSEQKNICLNEQQQLICDEIIKDYRLGVRKTYLVHGITGSGKTEVYMEIIEWVIKLGKQVIFLIPEIALTYQMVTRFYERFGDRVSVMHSKLSGGERYDQYMRAKNGEIDIMIGPRSALFTPFLRLGLIVVDEEHESSYKSETVPKYHAREVAIERARMLNASVILGSATPSIESYYLSQKGVYQRFTLNIRANKKPLPKVYIVDLREELKKKNHSIFSYQLRKLMQERLERKEQIILFINRRGYAGFVSCRNCGEVMQCPHCDISLTNHINGKLICHYCGYEVERPKICPKCQSKYIAAFGTGTQKVEEYVKKEFPNARVLRMDADTTKKKGGHEEILAAFSREEADILVGTQMIVKGHDFPKVTLVGVVAADLSLYSNDYRCAERTYQLLEQASGRAGRGTGIGEVVIQTYNPMHYSVQAAANHNYQELYEQELAFRSWMQYPPTAHMLAILITSKEEEKAELCSRMLAEALKEQDKNIRLIGPAKASLSKANDYYRRMLYIKNASYEYLKQAKNYLEGFIEFSEAFKKVSIQFDFDPMNGY